MHGLSVVGVELYEVSVMGTGVTAWVGVHGMSLVGTWFTVRIEVTKVHTVR